MQYEILSELVENNINRSELEKIYEFSIRYISEYKQIIKETKEDQEEYKNKRRKKIIAKTAATHSLIGAILGNNLVKSGKPVKDKNIYKFPSKKRIRKGTAIGAIGFGTLGAGLGYLRSKALDKEEEKSIDRYLKKKEKNK